MTKYKDQGVGLSVHCLGWTEREGVGILWLGSFSKKRIEFQALKNTPEFGACTRPIHGLRVGE